MPNKQRRTKFQRHSYVNIKRSCVVVGVTAAVYSDDVIAVVLTADTRWRLDGGNVLIRVVDGVDGFNGII